MRKAGFLIGHKAFTLVEVLMTLSVLIVGLILIIPTFHHTAKQMQYMSWRHEGGLLLNNKLVEAEEFYRLHQTFDEWQGSGELNSGARFYDYTIKPRTLNASETLYELQGLIQWGSGQGQISKNAYVTGAS